MTDTPPAIPPEEEQQPKLFDKKFLAFIGIVLLLALGLWLSYRPSAGQLQGMVDAPEFRISSKVTGRIEQFFVDDGEQVKAGQLLYQITSPEVAARTAQVAGALSAARAQEDKAKEGARPEDIRAAEAQWRRAEVAAELARETAERVERLYAQGVVAGQKADEARTNATAATEAAKAAKAQYDAARTGARPQDKAAAGGQVAQAEGALAEVQVAANETKVRAPVDGELGPRLAQVGELVPQGYPVFTLTQTQDPWVTINVREDQLQGLSQGTKLEGRIPALGKTSSFEVIFLAPSGEFATWRATRQSRGFDIKSFEVRAVPVQPIEDLRPGMTVLFNWPQ